MKSAKNLKKSSKATIITSQPLTSSHQMMSVVNEDLNEHSLLFQGGVKPSSKMSKGPIRDPTGLKTERGTKEPTEHCDREDVSI